MDPMFMFYAMECEGDIDSRFGIINNFINILAASDNPNDIQVQLNCAAQANLDLSTLSSDERTYIEQEVNSRLS